MPGRLSTNVHEPRTHLSHSDGDQTQANRKKPILVTGLGLSTLLPEKEAIFEEGLERHRLSGHWHTSLSWGGRGRNSEAVAMAGLGLKLRHIVRTEFPSCPAPNPKKIKGERESPVGW